MSRSDFTLERNRIKLGEKLGENPKNPIIAYDGSCGLCHRFVEFVLNHDHKSIFYFAPQSAVTLNSFLDQKTRAELPDSIWLLDQAGILHLKGDAIIVILKSLGSIWRLAASFYSIFPRVFRNKIYDLIAHRRYSYFGKTSEACPLIAPDLKKRFLD